MWTEIAIKSGSYYDYKDKVIEVLERQKIVNVDMLME